MSSSERLLSPYRVLDMTDGMCLSCGKILADLGAEVIQIEKPGGNQARYTAPFVNDVPGIDRSILSMALNQGKKSITLDLETERGRKLLRSLVSMSDILVESYEPGYLDSLGIGYASLIESNPRLVFTSITAFGQTGPYRKFRSSDLIVMALSGYLSLLGDQDRPPVRISFPIAFYLAGAEAAASSVAALYYRNQTGRGQSVDVSAQQVMALYTANAPAFWEIKKRLIVRSGQSRGEITTSVKSPQLWQCKDGWVSFAIYGGQIGARSNVPLLAWMEEEGMGDEKLKQIDWKTLDLASLSTEFFKEVQQRLEHFFSVHTKAELYEGAVQRGIILFPVYTMSEILKDKQLSARAFWTRVDCPGAGQKVPFPGAFAKASATPVGSAIPPPLLGQHNAEIYRGLLRIGAEEFNTFNRDGVI